MSAAGNRSPLGFGTILPFVLLVLGGAVLAQVVHEAYRGAWGLLVISLLGAGLVVLGVVVPRFYWDLFRSLKTAAVLITLLVLSCILGTLVIQELDLRRAGVFEKGEMKEDGKLPAFDDRQQSVRFALAEAHMALWLWPNEERSTMLEQKVKLSPTEREQVVLREQAFGAKAAAAYEDAILDSKRRQVEQLTTSNWARENWGTLYNIWEWTRRLHLFDIFEAWWFFLLLGLIAVNVIVGTIVLAPWNARQFGVAITHTGVIIVLSGSLLDLLVAKEGYIYFKYGKPAEQVHSMMGDDKNQVYHHLPFRVYLDRFATEHYHELYVQRTDWSRRHDGREWGQDRHRHARPFSVTSLFPVRTGVTRVFEDKDVQVIVHEYKPRVIVRTVVDDVPDGPLNPALRLGLYTSARGGKNYFVHESYDPWFYAFDERRSVDMYGGRFEYVWAESDAEYRRLTSEAPLPDNGTLVLRSGDGTTELPVVLGSRRQVTLDGKTITLEFVNIESALAAAENVNLDRRMQKSEEPILYVNVNGQLLPVPRDDSAFTRDFNVLEGVEFRFDWPNPTDAGVAAIFRVVDGEGRGPVLVQADGNDMAIVQPLNDGRPIPLIKLQGGYLGIEGRVRSARDRRAIEEISDQDFLGDTGGYEVDLSEALRAHLDAKGAEGMELATGLRMILRMQPQLPPHLLAAWREGLNMAESEGQSALRSEWENFLEDRGGGLLEAWRRYEQGAKQTFDERLLAAWADIEVTGRWGTVRREITPYDVPIAYGPDTDKPLYQILLVKTEQARDWFSVLSVIDHEDWKVDTHPVQVNSPLRHGGYRFFQATAATDRDGLGISGISVTRNPGVYFMYIGYTVLTLGVCYVFFAKPVIDYRRRKRRVAEVQAS